jgi:hypothetical protein
MNAQSYLPVDLVRQGTHKPVPGKGRPLAETLVPPPWQETS